MGVAERGRVLARGDQPGEMRHVDQQQRAHLVGDCAEAGEIEMARIGRAAGDDQLGPMLLGQPLDLVEVDQMVVAAHAVLDGVEPFARLGRRRAVGEVTAGGEAHAQDRVAGLQQRQHHRAIGLRARVRLDVGEAAAEQLLGALDGQGLDRVRRPAALVIAPPRIAFGIFVGQHRALRLEHRAADDIFRGDQLDLVLLALEFGADRVGDRRVGVAQPAGEKAFRLDVVQIRGGGHQSLSCRRVESMSTRRWWRPPAKSVPRKAETHALAMSGPISRAPERDDVGVIMLAGEGGGDRLVDPRAAALGVAVDGDRDADARAADGDAALGRAGRDGVRQPSAEIGIIDAFGVVGAEVADVIAKLAEPHRQLALEGETGMVGSKGDAHGHFLAPRARGFHRGSA